MSDTLITEQHRRILRRLQEADARKRLAPQEEPAQPNPKDARIARALRVAATMQYSVSPAGDFYADLLAALQERR